MNNAYEQLMALKSKGNTPATNAGEQGIAAHRIIGTAVHTVAKTGERLLTTARFVPEIWSAGRLSVRDSVAADILAIINR